MSKVPFAEYKIGFEKFLKSESGTIYVQCKTFNEASLILNMFGKKGEKFSLVKDLKSE